MIGLFVWSANAQVKPGKLEKFNRLGAIFWLAYDFFLLFILLDCSFLTFDVIQTCGASSTGQDFGSILT